MQALLGIIVLLALSWLMSENRGAISWRFVFIGIVVQGILAALFLHAPWLSGVLLTINGFVSAVGEATTAGTVFMFGFFGRRRFPGPIRRGVALSLCLSSAASSRGVLGCGRLALALAGVAYLVRGLSWALRKTFHVSGTVGHRRSGEPVSWHD